MILALALVMSSGVLGQDRPREHQPVQQDVIPEKLSIVPDAIDFQGRLHDTDGSPVNAILSITFAFYNVGAGGSPVWSETQSSVEVIDGLFQVRLGSMNPVHPDLFIDGETLWLAIQVDGEAEMSPRIQFASTGYAMKTFERDPTWEGNANPGDPISRSGNVGIGLSDPPALLSVSGPESNPAIPGSTSAGLLSLRLGLNEGMDFGKMGEIPHSGWIQAGFNLDVPDPLSLNPLGGNVGIGTNTPTQLLDVSGTFRLRGHLFDYNNTSGTNGQVLTRGASGVVWQDNGSSLWQVDGTNIFFNNTGRVAIGMMPNTAATQKLQLEGGTWVGLAVENENGGLPAIYANNRSVGGLAAMFMNAGGPVAHFGRNIRIVDGTQGAGKVLTSDAEGITSWQTPAPAPWQVNGDNIFFNTGKVGIGIDPSSTSRQFQVIGGSNIGIYAENSSSSYATLFVENKSITGGTAARFQAIGGTAAAFTGSILIADGTQGNGKILTSNGSGLASWQNPAPSPWQMNSNNTYFNTGNVAIGSIDYFVYPLNIFSPDPSCYIKLFDSGGTQGLRMGSNNGQMAFLNDNINQDIFFSTRTETTWLPRLTIDGATGNVGLGTSTPTEKLEVIGNQKITGNIQLTGELNRSSTGGANMVPIAYGNVASTGAINAGSGNFSVVFNSTLNRYEITITDQTYIWSTYITTVTPAGTFAVPVINSVSGKLLVNLYNASGTAIAGNFAFVVYKP